MSQKKSTIKGAAKPATPVTTTSAATMTRAKSSFLPKQELIFGKQNYIWMAVGMGLVALGMLLMLGGSMPSPDVWNDDIIYSFRITTLAPIVILLGLIVEVYAIFKE
ncbi:MAG: DUF3098 domain-containing protein [Saprospiraceae bacterium]|nr:DUF3098 domain-containing protein [Saprospiraceae bacterium]